MLSISVRGFHPQIGEGTFVAPNATLVGDVVVGKQASIWFNAVIRGDVMPIRIGDQTNIQDGSIIHGTYKKCGTTIGNRVTVGHGVILHGCEVGDEVLVGMSTTIMDLAQIPSRCIVGAGSLVTEEARFEEGWLILGRPAKAIRPLKPEELAFLGKSADNYLHYTKWFEEGEKGDPHGN
ncbi:MAG: gamma carbonic anhydrase family protein [Bdellovibrionaceae bacterium]|nr:gamma carbonic anhydrase family protein [Bdellovibrionales bacterium]MCB9083655.1 gamma carbonic anhydrase family protein [Pseudobdellovibrionaceae bacterium]